MPDTQRPPAQTPQPGSDAALSRLGQRRAQARKLLSRVRRAVQMQRLASYRRLPVRRDTVLYESFAGNGMLCNPEAIFRALLDDPDFTHLHHVWALDSFARNPTVVAEFAANPRVSFVRMYSRSYYRALSTSGYLVNNATFPPEFGKRPGQIYLNTWHGTPLKKMGYDIGDPAMRAGNVIRNFLSADFLLSSSPRMTETLYEGAYRLDQIYRGRIIEEGYPRIDRQFLEPDERDSVRKRLSDDGIVLGDRKIILYAPTWKGTNFNSPDDDAEELIERVEELRSAIDSSRFVVLLKTHQIVHRLAAGRTSVREYLVANEIPTNLVLGVTDILITDYSSIFFDFLPTDRPIVFFTPDMADYADYRGLYLEPSTWPGPIVTTIAALANELADLAAGRIRPEIEQRRRAARERFAHLEDGNATKRVIDIVFRGHTDGYRVVETMRDARPTVLLYAGGLRSNGITSSLLNLVAAIDHARVDVSVVFAGSYARVARANETKIDHRVRRFARVGGANGSKTGTVRRRLALRRGDLSRHASDAVERSYWDDEWTRCFGTARFDVVIDFSGYGPFWATLLLHAPGARRSIWLHNDLAADSHRPRAGNQRLYRDLPAIFSLYRGYDSLVSVSPSLASINARKLSAYADREQFVHAHNLINADAVRNAARIPIEVATVDPETGEVPAWATRLSEVDGTRTFVSVGRLSPEKNHARLIRAFATLHSQHADTRLIIVGDGALRSQLADLITELDLARHVWLVGHQTNPPAIMARADCFVLSSDYEGQPMVLLEALVVGLPVVTVAFESAADALPVGEGLIVAMSEEALADGMGRFLAGDVPGDRVFDAEAYNRMALSDFSTSVGLDCLDSQE